MAYVVLARKYRPQTLEDLVGQEHVSRTLQNSILQGRVAHALCFSGPRGTGKTTVARIFAKAMNCETGPTPTPCNKCVSCVSITAGNAVDVFEIDGASNNSVDQVRELRENVKYSPAAGRYKIYIIDEVHMLSAGAFNALLKTLEEPPPHVIFVLATTEVHKIPVTILSRCQRHDFRRIALPRIVAHLSRVCGLETFSMPEESLWTIARECSGCMRDALSLLDQVMAFSEGGVTQESVLDILGVVDVRSLFELSAAIIAKDIPRCLAVVEDLHLRGHDMKKLAGDLVEHFRNLLVVKAAKNPAALVAVPESEIKWLSEQAGEADQTLLNRLFYGLFREEALVRQSLSPKTALEAALIRLSEAAPAAGIDLVIKKLGWLKSLWEAQPGAATVYAAEPDPLPLAAPVAYAGGPPSPAASAETLPHDPAIALSQAKPRTAEPPSVFSAPSGAALPEADPAVMEEADDRADALPEEAEDGRGFREIPESVRRAVRTERPDPPERDEDEARALANHPIIEDVLDIFGSVRPEVVPLKK